MAGHAAHELNLAYGAGTQRAALPGNWNITTLRADPFTTGRPEPFLIEEALQHPVEAPPLEEWAAADDRILIVVSDKTRHCRTHVFLPPILDRLEQAGVPHDHIRILFATGTHPPQSEREQRDILGDAVYDRYAVFEHRARDEECCVFAGTTKAGTDVRINRLVAESDRVVATGTIVHHYFAGYGGGAKLLVPGVAAYSTAVANHRRTITPEGRFHPGCTDGRIAGNPVITDIQDAQRFLPPTWYFAAILNEEGGIAECVCGDLAAAHAQGCAVIDRHYRPAFDAPADLVVVSAGGHPRDINFIQSHKSLHHAHYAAKEGGSIVLLAECREGLGNDSFRDWFEYPSREAFRHALLEHYSMNAHTALAILEKSDHFRVILVSALDDATVRLMGMEPAADLSHALALAVDGMPSDPSVTVLENGALLVPRPRPEGGHHAS